jgi:hypothetical protein
MLKKTFINLLVVFIVILSCGLAQAATVTVGTFADPAGDGSMPLFTVNLDTDIISGGWLDTQTGLSLGIPYSGHTYHDAFFTMTNVSYSGSISGGSTGGGTIKFFKDGQSTSTTPLIQISFDSAHVTPFSFGAMNMFYPDGVIITGSEIVGSLTDGASFMFGFANHVPLSGDWSNGYTATASFTSSAVVPEPATLVLLGTAGIWIFTRKKQQFLGGHRNK